MCVSVSAQMAVVTVSKVTTLVQAYGASVSSLLLLWHGMLHVERILVMCVILSTFKGQDHSTIPPRLQKRS